MDIADMADKFIEDQVLISVMRIREHKVAQEASLCGADRYCVTCDTAIPRARLKAVPGSVHCIHCASKQERERPGMFTTVERHRINTELDDYLLNIC
ncbi:TraR/DksA C4-type zinc finger protein [Sedimenticola sp.]|uniref:TraR/DksA C4-type zinc finger protein n=1 Tax=Sedimenticola sp. TaxID=1940285 RepID=UPI003D0A797D